VWYYLLCPVHQLSRVRLLLTLVYPGTVHRVLVFFSADRVSSLFSSRSSQVRYCSTHPAPPRPSGYPLLFSYTIRIMSLLSRCSASCCRLRSLGSSSSLLFLLLFMVSLTSLRVPRGLNGIPTQLVQFLVTVDMCR
jgi:hypothetical protein